MSDDFWQEIQDMPSEIFDLDIPELKEDEFFDVNDHFEGEVDY